MLQDGENFPCECFSYAENDALDTGTRVMDFIEFGSWNGASKR